jgi:hypothetical protein
MWMEIPVLIGSPEVQEHPKAPPILREPTLQETPLQL